jgi:uncharacterized protein YecE (DUF72 family)
LKFGKLSGIQQVDFRMPPDPAVNELLWSQLAGSSGKPLAVYVGCTGWSMPSWVGEWYPRGTKSKDFLAAYGQQFNTIELNTTHYRIPTPEQVGKWRAAVPADFRFCPKVPQRISHDRNLGLGGEQLPLFWKALTCFGEQLGCCFVQLPPYFALDRLPLLRKWLQTWPAEFPLAVEVRHASWFTSEEVLASWAKVLREQGVAAVITDVAGRRDVLHQLVTTSTTMVRFVGNGLHSTDYERAADWIRRISYWQSRGLEEVFFFPHQPDNELAPEMALHLVNAWHEGESVHTRGPRKLGPAPTGGEQISLF